MTTGINGGDLTGAPENPNRRNFLKASAALATVGVVGKAAAEACNANGTTPCVLTLPNGAPTTLNLGLNQEQSSQGVYITLGNNGTQLAVRGAPANTQINCNGGTYVLMAAIPQNPVVDPNVKTVPTMGNVGIVTTGLALAGAAAYALHDRTKNGTPAKESSTNAMTGVGLAAAALAAGAALTSTPAKANTAQVYPNANGVHVITGMIPCTLQLTDHPGTAAITGPSTALQNTNILLNLVANDPDGIQDWNIVYTRRNSSGTVLASNVLVQSGNGNPPSSISTTIGGSAGNTFEYQFTIKDTLNKTTTGSWVVARN